MMLSVRLQTPQKYFSHIFHLSMQEDCQQTSWCMNYLMLQESVQILYSHFLNAQYLESYLNLTSPRTWTNPSKMLTAAWSSWKYSAAKEKVCSVRLVGDGFLHSLPYLRKLSSYSYLTPHHSSLAISNKSYSLCFCQPSNHLTNFHNLQSFFPWIDFASHSRLKPFSLLFREQETDSTDSWSGTNLWCSGIFFVQFVVLFTLFLILSVVFLKLFTYCVYVIFFHQLILYIQKSIKSSSKQLFLKNFHLSTTCICILQLLQHFYHHVSIEHTNITCKSLSPHTKFHSLQTMQLELWETKDYTKILSLWKYTTAWLAFLSTVRERRNGIAWNLRLRITIF